MTTKIINGKVYDTDKASLIADVQSVQLYLTPKGSWFLSDFYGDLKALSAEDAYTWLYQRSQAEAIKRYFPNRIEDA